MLKINFQFARNWKMFNRNKSQGGDSPINNDKLEQASLVRIERQRKEIKDWSQWHKYLEKRYRENFYVSMANRVTKGVKPNSGLNFLRIKQNISDIIKKRSVEKDENVKVADIGGAGSMQHFDLLFDGTFDHISEFHTIDLIPVKPGFVGLLEAINSMDPADHGEFERQILNSEQAKEALFKSKFLQGDAHSLPIKNNCYDLVILVRIMEYANPGEILQEVQRVTKKGGLIYINSDFAKDEKRHFETEAEYRDFFKKHGFSIESMELREYDPVQEAAMINNGGEKYLSVWIRKS